MVTVNPALISHETLLGKVIRLPFRLLPAGAVVRIVRGPARGKRWIADSSTHGFWLGYWEPGNQRRFAAHLKPGDVVYDIGAHVGLYTLISSGRVGSTGHVNSFEPFVRNAEFLRRHIALNHLANCTVVEAAVSSRTGRQFFDPTSHDSAGHLAESGQITVPTLSLDEFVFAATGNRPPNMIKINAEGAEVEVLIGGQRVLGEFSPVIFLSTHSVEIDSQCCDFLRTCGYTLERLAPDKIWATKEV
jgi:FkbM family methyltransferase